MPLRMKWGFASTAALVLAQQKDAFYANRLSEEIKAVALDWLDIRTFLKWEEWIEAGGKLVYWLLLTGSGSRSLGEEYVRIVPVDLKSRSLFLQKPQKRLIFACLTALLSLRKELDLLNSVQFYWTGKFPTLLHRLLSIRYIFHPRKPPLLDADRSFYHLTRLIKGTICAQFAQATQAAEFKTKTVGFSFSFISSKVSNLLGSSTFSCR